MIISKGKEHKQEAQYAQKGEGGALCFKWGFTQTFPGNQDVAVK